MVTIRQSLGILRIVATCDGTLAFDPFQNHRSISTLTYDLSFETTEKMVI